MNWIIVWLAKNLYGKQLLGIVDGLNGALSGKRSEILIALVAIIEVLKHSAIIDPKIADQINLCLLGALPVTVSEKIKKVVAQADQIIPTPSAPVQIPPTQ